MIKKKSIKKKTLNLKKVVKKRKKKIIKNKSSFILNKKNDKEKLYQNIKNKLLQEKNNLLEISKDKTTLKTIDTVDLEGDEIDRSQGENIIEITNHLHIRNNLKLLKIDGALKKIENNTYGQCEDCGEEITEKRLEANPYVLICISCAEEREMESNKKGTV